MKPGMYTNQTNEEYHAGPGLSSSHVRHMQKSAAHYRAWLNEPKESKSEQQRLGSLTHTLLLEPERFESEYAMRPVDDTGKQIHANSSAYKEWAKANEGKTFITQEQLEHAKGMVASIQKGIGEHPEFKYLLKGHKEASYYWQDEKTGLLCKCRPDVTAAGFLVDLKTVADASQNAFQKDIATYAYHIQAAFYLEGLKTCMAQCPEVAQAVGTAPELFAFIAVESLPPYEFNVFMLGKSSLEFGKAQIRKAMDRHKTCVSANSWPGYERNVVEVELPNWYYYSVSGQAKGK